ncbi:hypothetical protein BVX99_02385 [bacterium F16]|nr:hypothetical protein BVX99_02385 [bacterium F16]
MGSCTFHTVAYGNTPQEAYQQAIEDANNQNGHQDGYSGDIQTTEWFEMVEPDKGQNVSDKVEETIDNYHKWGPCGCIMLEKGKYLFYGWAAE